ncbi:MAG: hypothetical protein ACI9LE_000150 [Paraglaciecola sp.]|jgi:hypothetical protein
MNKCSATIITYRAGFKAISVGQPSAAMIIFDLGLGLQCLQIAILPRMPRLNRFKLWLSSVF